MSHAEQELRLNDVLEMVYQQLRQYASRILHWEAEGITLQTTDLVHEAYLRLSELREIQWHDEQQIMRIAVGVMRRVLVDHARARQALKRKPPGKRVFIAENTVAVSESDPAKVDLLYLHEALERLASFDARKAEVVELRYFGGFSEQEVANSLSISVATVKRDWTIAKAWLFRELKHEA